MNRSSIYKNKYKSTYHSSFFLVLSIVLYALWPQTGVAEDREECPTNLAPGAHSIQLLVTASLNTAQDMYKAAGNSSWIYESVTGNYVVSSGVFEERAYAVESLTHLRVVRGESHIPKDAYIVRVNLDRVARGVCP